MMKEYDDDDDNNHSRMENQKKKHSKPQNSNQLIIPPEDDHDDRSHDDPYVYSDDSGSLSDAYFFPDGDRKNHLYTSYGTVETYTHGLTTPRSFNSATATILEDSPVTQATPLVSISQPSNITPSRNSSRSSRKHQRQKMQRKLQEQRERAVTKVRGKPQPQNAQHDSFWLFLFTVQLLFVFGCAVRFGWTLMQPTSIDQDIKSLYTSSNRATAELLALPGDKDLLKRATNRTFGPLLNNSSSSSEINFNTNTTAVPPQLQNLQDDDSLQQETPKKNRKIKYDGSEAF